MKTKNVNYKRLEHLMQLRPETPEGKSGGVSVTHQIVQPGEEQCVVSWRNAILMGQRPTKVKFAEPTIIRSLSQEGYGNWMTDSPQEVWQMDEPLRKMQGRVLVGGLGLGVFPHLLQSTTVEQVTVVEKSKAVCDLVSPHIDTKVIVLLGNLFDFLKGIGHRDYDSAFLDIWQPTGEMAWAEYIVPLRRLARGKIKKVLCWNEVEMQGQLRMGLPHYAVMDDSVNGAMPYQECFRSVCRGAGVKPTINRDMFKDNMAVLERRIESEKNPLINRLLQTYLEPGTWRWEKVFGETWDRLTSSKESE